MRCGAGSLQEQQRRVMSSPSLLSTRLKLAGSAVGRYVASMQDVRIFID
jgi:hypothetical protein